MVYVILRTGKVLKYNDAEYVGNDGEWLIISQKETDDNFIAKIPQDVVERCEWMPPCRIMQTTTHRKKAKYRG